MEEKSKAYAKDIFIMPTTESRIVAHPLAAIRYYSAEKYKGHGMPETAFGVYRHRKHGSLHVFAGYSDHPAFERVCPCPTFAELLATEGFDSVILAKGDYGNRVQIGSKSAQGKHSWATLMLVIVAELDITEFVYRADDESKNELF